MSCVLGTQPQGAQIWSLLRDMGLAFVSNMGVSAIDRRQCDREPVHLCDRNHVSGLYGFRRRNLVASSPINWVARGWWSILQLARSQDKSIMTNSAT